MLRAKNNHHQKMEIDSSHIKDSIAKVTMWHHVQDSIAQRRMDSINYVKAMIDSNTLHLSTPKEYELAAEPKVEGAQHMDIAVQLLISGLTKGEILEYPATKLPMPLKISGSRVYLKSFRFMPIRLTAERFTSPYM